MQDELPVGATFVPVICASDKTYLTKISSNQHPWPLNLTIGTIQIDIHCTPKIHRWIVFGMIPSPPDIAKNIDEAWHSMVGILLSPLWNLHISGSGLKWDCADGLQRQCYPLLAAWVRDYPE
jgi:hypothetical protein